VTQPKGQQVSISIEYLETYHVLDYYSYSRRWRTLVRPPLRPLCDLWARCARFCNWPTNFSDHITVTDFEFVPTCIFCTVRFPVSFFVSFSLSTLRSSPHYLSRRWARRPIHYDSALIVLSIYYTRHSGTRLETHK